MSRSYSGAPKMPKVMAGFFPEFTLSKTQLLSAISARSSRFQFPP